MKKWKDEIGPSVSPWILNKTHGWGIWAFKNAWPLVIQARLWNEWKEWNQTERMKKEHFQIYSMTSYISNNCTYDHKERNIWIQIKRGTIVFCSGLHKWSLILQRFLTELIYSNDDFISGHCEAWRPRSLFTSIIRTTTLFCILYEFLFYVPQKEKVICTWKDMMTVFWFLDKLSR